MCPVRLGYPKLLPCWCHVGCSYQTHIGRVCPCHIRILDPKRKIVVLSHPSMEDYVTLPTRAAVRTENRLTTKEIKFKMLREDQSLSKWCAARWTNILVEKHAWLSAGLISCKL